MTKTLRYLKPYRGTVAAGLVLKFIGAVAELFLPLLLEYIINDVAINTELSSETRIRLIIYLGLIMLGCSLVALLGNIFANRLTVKSSGNMTHDLRYDLFSKTSYLNSKQVDEFGVPSLISRLTSDSYYVNQMVARTLRLGVRAPILILGGIILAFWRDAVLACVLLACVPLVGLTIFFITRKSVPVYFKVQHKQDDMVRDMQENVTGVRVIKALNKSEYETEKFDDLVKELAAEEFRANKIMSISNPLATLILNLGLVAVIVVGAVRGNMPGTVLAFLQYFVIILNAMIALSKIFVVISRGSASAARIEKVLDTDVSELIEDKPLGDEKYKIQFNNVSFSYNGVKENLKNINFAIKPGQMLGIIGATGSGKSTIINLMMRFYDVGGGAIFIDGKDVKSYSSKELRRKFGVAFQNDFLMAASIRENIDYGRGLTDEEINAAIDAAQAREFVDSVGGLNYSLAQKANNISGGQKQRLLVARALAGSPEIVVLDDSSSALDYGTDAALRKALSKIQGATFVIVAQRISSIKNADHILVLDDGEIIGQGTHDELKVSCAEYAMIYSTQMGDEDGKI
ncbi:MAG: ABC transporter ATP-binding protein [Clostridiales bacterium]|nr:ABC transporter ATP-binding protein [Clostridiales bacterium]